MVVVLVYWSPTLIIAILKHPRSGELGEQETRSGYVEDPHLTYRIINNKDVFHSTLLQIRR